MNKNKNNYIAHMADLHVMFGSRHDEHEYVFKKTVEDISKENPKRIVIAGDLFHQKINMSPSSIKIIGNFLSKLSEIAPVDVILGNHDLSLNSLSQGNCIEPIVALISNGIVVEKGIKNIPKLKDGVNGIYFYPHSGFYNVDDDIVYGVYSCLDNEILKLNLKDRDVDKNYIALFHGAMYGSMADNGMQLKGDELIKPNIFDNFDIVMLGDIHEYQSLQEYEKKEGVIKPSIAYPSSILQLNYGESLKKGYLLWDLTKKEHERRFILNKWGFAKLNISKGEIIEDRLNDIEFSLDKIKTKVWIEIEDDEENYSVEKLSQIRKIVKNKYGCENIHVEFKSIFKNKELNEEALSIKIDEHSAVNDFETMLVEFLKQNDYENFEDVIELSREVDQKLNYTPPKFGGISWKINKMIVRNILSFGDKEYVFDFDKLNGIVGIFGSNYSGKSNIIKSLIWGLYQKILGDGESTKIVNIYSKSKNGFVKVYFTIGEQKYYSYREAFVKTKKDETQEVTYKTEYKIFDETLNVWADVDSSENAAIEKKERKKLISEALGNYDDFIRVCLQAQTGAQDYLLISQQDKNLMLSRFLGLEIFRDRYEFANENFKKIKAVQKSLGDPSEIEKEIKDTQENNNEKKNKLLLYSTEKKKTNDIIDNINLKIREISSKLTTTETSTETDEYSIDEKVKIINNKNEKLTTEEEELSKWLDVHHLKEIPLEFNGLKNSKQIENELLEIKNEFSIQKEKYINLDKWLKENQKQEEVDYKPIENEILDTREKLNHLKAQLKLSRGEKCPTCNHVSHEPNKDLELSCLSLIDVNEKNILTLNKKLDDAKKILTTNANFDKQINNLESIKNNLTSNKLLMEKLKNDIENAKNIDIVKIHNDVVIEKSKRSRNIGDEKNNFQKEIERLNNERLKIKKNIKIIEENKIYKKEIEELDENIKEYKVVNLQYETLIKNLNSDVRLNDNNIFLLQKKLDDIREADRVYKKYSVYLQSVDKHGIPSKIIQKKLGIINHRINSILNNIVEFKLELYLKNNADIKEHVFFNDEKTDSLPASMTSGSQRFLGSLAIRQALQSISYLSRPNLFILDEGMDSLDQDKISSMNMVLNLLKNKFEHVFVISHNSSIKDFCDHTITVSKTKENDPLEMGEKSTEAGTATTIEIT